MSDRSQQGILPAPSVHALEDHSHSCGAVAICTGLVLEETFTADPRRVNQSEMRPMAVRLRVFLRFEYFALIVLVRSGNGEIGNHTQAVLYIVLIKMFCKYLFL